MKISRRLFALAMTIAMMFAVMLAAPRAYADEAEGVIEVTSTDPCAVELTGVSDNAGEYKQSGTVNNKFAFTVSVDEPGTYEYELKQVASQGMEIYDPTIYRVWVSAYYEGDTMQAMVTGGITGTDDKPDAFKFAKPAEETPVIEDDASPIERATITSTGDNSNAFVYGTAIAVGFFLLMLTGAIRFISWRRDR